MIYLASSSKNNEILDQVIKLLTGEEQDYYDFRKDNDLKHNPELTFEEMIKSLYYGFDVVRQYYRNFEALKRCDTTILVMPCGRSAHLELGYAIGKNKKACVYFHHSVVFDGARDIMYKMCDIVIGPFQLLQWLREGKTNVPPL